MQTIKEKLNLNLLKDIVLFEEDSQIETISAKKLLLKNKRFDLIVKYIYAKYRELNINTNFYKNMYLEHIRAFNNFNEPDGNKNCPDDFINSFNNVIDEIKKNGFDETKGIIPVTENYECLDGAHRVAACAVLGIDVKIIKLKLNPNYNPEFYNYDYKFFLNQGMNKDYMDFATYEYVYLNDNAFIINIHSIAPKSKDKEVESILKQYGNVFFQKEVELNFNGYLYTKLLSYGKEEWAGNFKNNFEGAREHTFKSMGKDPLRIFVLNCNSIEQTRTIKEKIRKIYNIGNFPIHINDFHQEAIELAQVYFNKNTINFINNSQIQKQEKLNSFIEFLKDFLEKNNISNEHAVAVGSTPMALYNLREAKDLDFISLYDNINTQNKDVTLHNSELKYYPTSKDNMIFNPENYLYYKGFKIITLDVLKQMKEKRAEYPKDFNDIKLIEPIIKSSKKTKIIDFQKIKSIIIDYYILNNLKHLKYNTKKHLKFLKRKPLKYLELLITFRLSRIPD